MPVPHDPDLPYAVLVDRQQSSAYPQDTVLARFRDSDDAIEFTEPFAHGAVKIVDTSPPPPIPTTLGTVIRSKLTGMHLVRLRSGWVNFNQSVSHPDGMDPDEWTVLYDASVN